MAKVTFVLGLAGSGKTHQAKNICEQTGAEFLEGTEGDGTKKKLLFQNLTDGKDCVVEEIAYCLPSRREKIVLELCSFKSDLEIEWICLENDLESANWNVKHRINKGDVQGHLRINQCYHGLYIYPGGAKIIPIIRIKENKTSN